MNVIAFPLLNLIRVRYHPTAVWIFASCMVANAGLALTRPVAAQRSIRLWLSWSIQLPK